MISLIATLALAAAQPEPNSDEAFRQFCAEVNAQAQAAGHEPISCADEPEPLSGPATLELCLNESGAGRHPDCRALLEPEAALVPDALFSAAIETPPARRDGWLGAICGPDRLAAGQTAEVCRADAEARLQRSRLARMALAGRNASGGLGDPSGDWRTAGASRFDVVWGEAGREPVDVYAAPAAEPPAGRERERCRRRADVRRDPDTGDSSSSYSFTCSWGDGDPDNEARARDLLDSLMRDD